MTWKFFLPDNIKSEKSNNVLVVLKTIMTLRTSRLFSLDKGRKLSFAMLSFQVYRAVQGRRMIK